MGFPFRYDMQREPTKGEIKSITDYVGREYGIPIQIRNNHLSCTVDSSEQAISMINGLSSQDNLSDLFEPVLPPPPDPYSVFKVFGWSPKAVDESL